MKYALQFARVVNVFQDCTVEVEADNPEEALETARKIVADDDVWVTDPDHQKIGEADYIGWEIVIEC